MKIHEHLVEMRVLFQVASRLLRCGSVTPRGDEPMATTSTSAVQPRLRERGHTFVAVAATSGPRRLRLTAPTTRTARRREADFQFTDSGARVPDDGASGACGEQTSPDSTPPLRLRADPDLSGGNARARIPANEFTRSRLTDCLPNQWSGDGFVVEGRHFDPPGRRVRARPPEEGAGPSGAT